jgi:type III secretion protein D
MELRMLSGLHRGAALEIGEGEITLGSSPEADVLIADPGVAPLHARIRREGPNLLLIPGEGPVRDAAGRSIADVIDLARGAVYRLGEVWIGFFAEQDPWLDALPQAAAPSLPPPEPAAAEEPAPHSPLARLLARLPKTRLTIGIIGLLVALALSIAFASLLRRPDDVRPVKRAAAAKATAAAASIIEETAAPQQLPPAQLQRLFMQQLGDRSLQDNLDVDFGTDAWNVKGSLDEDERGRLNRMIQAFERKYRPSAQIRVSIVPWSDMLPFRVVQITSGKSANVVLDSGQRLFVGDSAGEYRLVSVDPGKAVFQGKRRIEVAW